MSQWNLWPVINSSTQLARCCFFSLSLINSQTPKKARNIAWNVVGITYVFLKESYSIKKKESKEERKWRKVGGREKRRQGGRKRKGRIKKGNLLWIMKIGANAIKSNLIVTILLLRQSSLYYIQYPIWNIFHTSEHGT